LRKCYKKRDLLRALESLPKTLDSTYERILLQIPQEYADDASVVFKVLSCASRPILLHEAADIIAVDLASDSFDPEDRPNDPSAILAICSTLLSSVEASPYTLGEIRTVADLFFGIEEDDLEILNSSDGPSLYELPYRPGERELNFSHLSVKEYLESDGAPPSFRITPEDANATMARLGLIVLVSAELSLPFITYASKYWLHHAQKSNRQNYFDFESLAQKLFEKPNSGRLGSWMRINVQRFKPHRMMGKEVTTEVRLFYASFLGFSSICQTFIENGANVNAVVEETFQGALTGACLGGHKAIVELLVDHGADPNPRPTNYTPLEAACSRGDIEIVRLLLAKTIDIDSTTLAIGLLTAVKVGALELVQLFLDRGVEVDSVHYAGCYAVNNGASPLVAAVQSGNEQLVRLLLKHGADVNSKKNVNSSGRPSLSPLQTAVFAKDETMVQLLLENGADVKQKDYLGADALVDAVGVAHEAESILVLLLAHISRADVERGFYDLAFDKACYRCPESVLRLFEAAGFGSRVHRLRSEYRRSRWMTAMNIK
jgi:ankyrin repeat protein